MCGRLTKDPEVRYSNEKAVAKFAIAVDRKFKKDETDFFNCTAFGKQAEFIEKYLSKGTKILLCGRVENNNYTNKDGEKVYSFGIMVDEIEFAESKRNDAPKKDDDFIDVPENIADSLPFM